MPEIKIKLFASFREFTDTKELVLEGRTVRDILESLFRRFEGFEKLIFEDGNVHPYVNIFINGNSIHESGGLGVEVNHGDELAIFPPVSGG